MKTKSIKMEDNQKNMRRKMSLKISKWNNNKLIKLKKDEKKVKHQASSSDMDACSDASSGLKLLDFLKYCVKKFLKIE